MMRTLGIPARQLTTFDSGHDSPNEYGVYEHVYHRYFDADTGKFLEMTHSIWNFHNWVDAWMSRPDLPEGYGGWNAVDATPQEHSEGVFQMGPASLHAVRQTEDDHAYDTPFVISEVNARVYDYLVRDNRIVKELGDTWFESLASLIATKDFLSDDMVDMTSEYRPVEPERMRPANGLPENSMSVVVEPVMYGEDIKMSVRFEGVARGVAERVDFTIFGYQTDYTNSKQTLFTSLSDVVVLSEENDYSAVFEHTITVEQYTNLMQKSNYYSVSVRAVFHGTNDDRVLMVPVYLPLAHLDMSYEVANVEFESSAKVIARYFNNLPSVLSNVQLELQSPSLGVDERMILGTIPANESIQMSKEIDLTDMPSGVYYVDAVLVSDEWEGAVYGSLKLVL
jgi:hypothetical protein